MEANTLIYANPINRALIHINYRFSEEAPLFVLTSTAEKGMCFINKLIYLLIARSQCIDEPTSHDYGVANYKYFRPEMCPRYAEVFDTLSQNVPIKLKRNKRWE